MTNIMTAAETAAAAAALVGKLSAETRALDWEQGKSGGTAAQRRYADRVIKDQMVKRAISFGVGKSWQEAERRIKSAMDRINRNAGNALDEIRRHRCPETMTPERWAEDRIAHFSGR